MKHVRKNFLSNESGQIGVIFALSVLPLLALTSAAVDYSKITNERNQISNALDAAVLAAANNNAITLDAKDEYAATHFNANYDGGLQLALSSSVTSDSVRLVARGTHQMTFGSIVGIGDVPVEDSSAASLSSNNTICVLALSEDAPNSIAYDSDLEFKATNCSVHSNSTSASAINAELNIHKPIAKSFCAVGGVTGEVEPHSKGECRSVADPYENVVGATIETCKSEFSLHDMNDETVNDAGNGSSEDVSLPDQNPVKMGSLIYQLRELYDLQGLGTWRGPNNGTRAAIKAVQELSGDDMRQLLRAYDSYGENLNCRDNPLPACYGFNNPFLNTDPDLIPTKSMVADIFNISYGDLIPPPEDVPDMVLDGHVELIDGRFYSRNNADNQLVPVSANATGGGIVLTPGTYCGGLTIDGISVRFKTGDYVFKDGPLTFLNNSQATANLVTFGFTGIGATLNVEGGSNLTIKARTTGPRKGLAFMQIVDRDSAGNRTPTPGVNRIAGGGSVSMSGTAYFPEQSLLISGEDSSIGSNSSAVGLIANTLEFRGNRGSRVELDVDHVKAGIPPIEPRADDGVRLIE